MKLVRIVMLVWVLGILLPSYAANKRALLPCLSNIKVKLDGIPDEDFWKKSCKIDDFQLFKRKHLDAPQVTVVRLCLDDKNCYIAVECDEPLGVVKGDPDGSAWSGDQVEIFLGSPEGKDWYRQIVFGLNGKTYNEFIEDADMSRAVYAGEKRWSAELIIPRSALGEFQDKLYFNMLRGRKNAKHTLTWSDIVWAVDMHRFGILQIYTPENEIIRGPWCAENGDTSAVIAFETADNCAASVFYRKKGENTFQEVYTDIEGSIQDSADSLHHVLLKNLQPGTVYEYHTGNNDIRTFTTLTAEPADFTFAVTTDTHGRDKALREVLKRSDVQKADIFIHLGDMITGVVGRNSFYEGYLSAMSDLWQKPFFSLRGNHEYRGNAPGVFFDMLYPVSRKAYYSFVYKGVYFMVLDFDGDLCHDTDYIDEQCKWLAEEVKRPEFSAAEFRVMLVHQPLFAGRGGGKTLCKVFSGLPEKAQNSFDLAFSGHVHIYEKSMPGDKYIFSLHPGRNGKVEAMPLKFPVLTGEKESAIIVEKNSKQLLIKVFSKAQNKQVDEIVIKRK